MSVFVPLALSWPDKRFASMKMEHFGVGDKNVNAPQDVDFTATLTNWKIPHYDKHYN